VPAGIVMLIVFLAYQQVENHVLNPVIMSRTVRLNPFWVLLAVLIGATLGGRVGSSLGTFVGALIGIPFGGALQVVVREIRRGPDGELVRAAPREQVRTVE
jgi:predicted PurR-regulated permease PerM